MANKKKVHAYTEEFRKEAVRRAEQKGNSNQSIAAELGISAQQIYNWRRQFKRCGGNQFSTIQGVKFHQEDSEEVQAFKRQLADLKEENAFLKKAAVDSSGQCNSYTKILICMRTLQATKSKVRTH